MSADTAPRSVSNAELGDALAVGSAALGMALSPPHVDRLVAYLRLIERWNGTYNLTAIRDPRAMVSQHILDCVAAATALSRRRGPGRDERVLDVGSGAGLPGLVLAALSPQRHVVCVDSVGKKVAFIRQAAAVLQLSNVTALHARVEAMAHRQFQVVVSRAFGSLNDFVSVTRRLVAPNGTWMAMKAKPPQEELAAVTDLDCEVEPLTIPGSSAERCIVWMQMKQVPAYV